MAISSPVSIGNATPNAASATTITLTTTGAVPSGAKIVVIVGWFGATTLSSVGDGTNTYTVDSTAANGSDKCALAWSDATTGLGSGATITVTYSAASTSRYAAAMYVTGAATGAATARSSGTTGTTAWTSGALTVPSGSLLIGGCYCEVGGGTNTPSGGNTEVSDQNIAGDSALATEYQIGTGASIAIQGTWTASSANAAIAVQFADAGGPAPAYPVVQTTAETAVVTAATSHPITLPTGIAVGDLILILLDKGSTAATFNALAGWTELVDENLGNGITMWYRKADGTEGATVTFTSSATTRSATLAYRISGAIDPATQAPELSTVATGTSLAPDSSTCTPTGGVKDYLWISMFGQAGEELDDDTWVNSGPTGYGNLLQKSCGTVGTNLGGLIGAANVGKTAASEDPGAFNVDVSAAWRAYTIAVHPAAAAPSIPELVMAPLSH